MYPFERDPNARKIAEALTSLPSNWSLTPIWDKSPKREGWQTEETVSRDLIAKLILDGESKISKKGNPYTVYASGYGLRTGEFSDGLVAIDVDGSSAQPILDAISNGDIPCTVSWTSGKAGRKQLLFQLPEEYRSQLREFNRAVVTEWEDIKTVRDENGKPIEILEFRYNRAQSCLPPSRHPTTGAYKWIVSPEQSEVAIAPQWLCDLLVKLSLQGDTRQDSRPVDWSEYKKTVSRGLSNSKNLSDFLMFDVYPRLSPDQIFCWSGHNFKQFGKTFKGTPPWRQSASGTSFHVWWDGEQWAWQDKGLGIGGGAVQYRWKLKGGAGKPKGKDFVEIVKELASCAGLEMPAFKKESIAIAESKILDSEEQSLAIKNAEIFSRQDIEPQVLKECVDRWSPEMIANVWRLLSNESRIRIKLLIQGSMCHESQVS